MKMKMKMNVKLERKEYIFEDDRPFRSCHASTLVVLDNDEVLAAWFGGTAEKNSDVAIWMARRNNGQWGESFKIADEEGIAHWNPVLFQGRDRKLFLFYKVGHEITDWFTRVMISCDDGHSWSEAKELVAGDKGGRGPVKNKPIWLKDGTIAAPASIERLDARTGREIWEAFVDISRDNGETWVAGNKVPFKAGELKGRQHFKATGIIQPALWESSEGLHMLVRSTEGHIYRSDSADGGYTWCEAYPTGLANNNSGIDLVKMENGTLALVYNPVSGQSTRTARYPLSVIFSMDNGATWQDERHLEETPGEYSYPAIVEKGNSLYITYTWNRERIAFVTLEGGET